MIFAAKKKWMINQLGDLFILYRINVYGLEKHKWVFHAAENILP